MDLKRKKKGKKEKEISRECVKEVEEGAEGFGLNRTIHQLPKDPVTEVLKFWHELYSFAVHVDEAWLWI